MKKILYTIVIIINFSLIHANAQLALNDNEERDKLYQEAQEDL